LKITKDRLFELLSARHEDNPYSKLANLPSPKNFKDIDKACQRIKQAVVQNQTITIVGDYDVDGVVSTTIMLDFFRQANINVKHIIPNRFKHGYGLSTKIIDLIDNGLVITVDNGISAVEASHKLKEKGIDLIITDHHTVGEELPYAYAIINPKQDDCKFEFKDICGAQVAWYLCAAVKNELNLDINMSTFLDLLCIAIVADVMPMTALNYTMVKQGLKKLKASNRASLKKLNELLNKETLCSDDIGFFIAPKLNSAGRMADASLALEFLLSKSAHEANSNLFQLEELNTYRKDLQEQISKKAQDKFDENSEAVIVWGEDWHEGVIGIVASKLSGNYKRPAFIFSITNGIAKGSARANANINLHTIISKASHLLLGFGGHKNAAGLSLKVENLEEFKDIINNQLKVKSEDLHIEPESLGELDVASVDLNFLTILESFEPYGLENSKPTFKISDAKLLKTTLVGKDKNHLKLTLNSDGFVFEAIKFNDDNIDLQQFISIIVSVNKNEFRGQVSPQFLIKDIL
jgi:single-stranded-DNA-specific exonuclease